jgi:hypothetical protein
MADPTALAAAALRAETEAQDKLTQAYRLRREAAQLPYLMDLVIAGLHDEMWQGQAADDAKAELRDASSIVDNAAYDLDEIAAALSAEAETLLNQAATLRQHATTQEH